MSFALTITRTRRKIKGVRYFFRWAKLGNSLLMAGNNTQKTAVVSNKKIIVTQNMDYNIREMTIGDYEEAYHLLFSIYDCRYLRHKFAIDCFIMHNTVLELQRSFGMQKLAGIKYGSHGIGKQFKW